MLEEGFGDSGGEVDGGARRGDRHLEGWMVSMRGTEEVSLLPPVFADGDAVVV